MKLFQGVIPHWVLQYRPVWLAGDLSAGLVVALMLVPQSMAYAIVSGLPPVTGLYASLLPSLVYAWFGSSSVQSVGTMAITSVMMGTSLASMRPASTEEAIAISAAVALMAGLVLTIASMLRLGFLSTLISRPVLSGFTSGSALMIAFSQLRYLLGPEPSAWTLLGMPLPQINLNSVGVGLGSLAALWLAKRYAIDFFRTIGCRARLADILSKLLPFTVIVMASLIVAWFGMGDVRLVGEVPSGLPSLQWPGLRQWDSLIPTALSMALMVFLFGQSSSVALGRKRGERILADRELFALGASNIAAAISGSFPVTGSISRSAVNFQAGANTQLASVLSVLFLALALASSTAWLSLLPMPALAAMIILAVVSMMEWGMLAEAWRVDRRDGLTCFVTAFGVIVLGFNEGIIAGLLLSMVFAIASLGLSGFWRALRGKSYVSLTQISSSFDVSSPNKGCSPIEVMSPTEAGSGVASLNAYHVRLEGALLFANAETLCEAVQVRLQSLTEKSHGEKTDLIIDLSALTDLDLTAIQVLSELQGTLSTHGFVMHWVMPNAALSARLGREARLLALIASRKLS
jgi:sulfate permease, SulP family